MQSPWAIRGRVGQCSRREVFREPNDGRVAAREARLETLLRPSLIDKVDDAEAPRLLVLSHVSHGTHERREVRIPRKEDYEGCGSGSR